MRRHLFRSALFAATLAAVLAPGTAVPGAAFRSLKEGQPAPPFTLKDAAGVDIAFKPDAGKVTVLSFVDLSQDRSRDQLKDLAALQADLGGKGVEFLTVIKYTNTPDEAKKAAAEFGLKFPLLFDKDQKAYGDYGLFVLPATGVIGKDGKFLFDHSGHGRDYKEVVGGRVKVTLGLMSEEDYKKAVTPVESAPKSREESEAERELALGRTLMKRGMPDKALEKFAKAVEFDPKNLEARIAYGEALVAAKKLDEALAQFQKAREMAPQNKDVQLGVGTVLLEKGEVDKAIVEIQGAAMLNPKPAKAHYWLGAAYEKKGDLPNAVKFYKKALEKYIKE